MTAKKAADPAPPLDPSPAARRELARTIRRVLKAERVKNWHSAFLVISHTDGTITTMMPVVTRRVTT